MYLELFKQESIYPFYKDQFYDGSKLTRHRVCIKCKNLECLKLLNNEINKENRVCSEGFDNYLVLFGGEKYIIFGVISSNNTKISKDRKDSRKDYILTSNYIDIISSKLGKIEVLISAKIKQDIEKNFGVFHDVKSSVGIVQSCIEGYVADRPGNDFTEKLKNCDKNLQDLYDAMTLVNSQLAMIDIVVNTKSISQGSMHYINIFKMFHRMAKLFQHKASKKNIQIVWSDNSQSIPDTIAFQSLEFIPLILLDNAIKYSYVNNKIFVTFEVIQKVIKICISTYGKRVPSDQKEKIFDKYFRGSNAEDYESGGIGLGLWIAKKIIIAHQGQIWYELNDNARVGFNKFYFTLPVKNLPH